MNQHHKRNMSDNRRKAALEARKREEEIESLFSICDWDHSSGLKVGSSQVTWSRDFRQDGPPDHLDGGSDGRDLSRRDCHICVPNVPLLGQVTRERQRQRERDRESLGETETETERQRDRHMSIPPSPDWVKSGSGINCGRS